MRITYNRWAEMATETLLTACLREAAGVAMFSHFNLCTVSAVGYAVVSYTLSVTIINVKYDVAP